MPDDFDYDEAVRELAAMGEANPREWVVCRDRETAEALVAWINENFPDG